jgi:hypothetical protein
MNMQAQVQTEVLKEAATTGVVDVEEVCSHVARADCRDVAGALELLAAQHAIDLPDGLNTSDASAPVPPLLGLGPPLNVPVTIPTRTRVILLPDASVDLRTAAACVHVELRDIVAAVVRCELRATDTDPGRPGVWLVRAGDLYAWARRHGRESRVTR